MTGALPRPKRRSTKPKPEVAPEDVLYTDRDRSGDIVDLALDSLCPNPFNRREMKGVPELAATIREVGLLQHIAHIRAEVWRQSYPETADQITAPNVILFGEHRWRALQELGWEKIPSVLRDDKVEVARLITLVENLRRAQLSPLEEAEHYQELRKAGLSYEQIAEKVGETAEGAVSKGTVWKRVQLLGLAPEIQQALRDGTLKVSAAEKAQKLDEQDQRDYLRLVREGLHPAEAHAQVLASQRRPDDSPDEVVVSAGNGVGGTVSPIPNPAPVSAGNEETPPPRQRRVKPSVANGDADRRAAAAARDTHCRRLVETTDPADTRSHELILAVLTAGVLAPQQQVAAQQRAYTWLRETNRNGLDAADAAAYFSAVQDSDDPTLQRLAAFASALAAAELRTGARRQSWSSREIHHVRILQEYAQYSPETEWEQNALGLVTSGGDR
ncbi:ParB/RepB/Spo0J family partition protein [Streptomyces sp. NPDC049879]|uniref:ParB/RepB/Spo0J family partition protein n=1 Tax=Streptomyces sp. NPDC049879 TaxID=3365598 RepID=UPI0037ABDFB0